MSRYRRISVCLEEEEEECILRRFVKIVIAERKFVLRKGVAPPPQNGGQGFDAFDFVTGLGPT